MAGTPRNMARTPRNPAPSSQEPDYDVDTGEVERERPAGTSVVEFGRISAADYEVVKYVSIPMLGEREVPAGATFICQIAEKAKILPPLEGVKPKFPGDFMAVTIKAPNGEARLLPWSTVLKSEMERDYPDGGYVGRWFQITRLPMKRGKAYWTYAIAEVKPRSLATAA